MIRAGFLSATDRRDLIALARDGSAAHQLARRAKALVLLDDGLSCGQVAKVLYIDGDTIRQWHGRFAEQGLKGIASFEAGGSIGLLDDAQQARLIAFVAQTLPRSTREIRTFMLTEFGLADEGRSGVVGLLHRLGLEYRKPKAIRRKLDDNRQQAFINVYENLLNSLSDDEAVLFIDADQRGCRRAADGQAGRALRLPEAAQDEADPPA